jgi:hypothetical protein
MSAQGSQVHCPYCPRSLPSRGAVNRHISHTPKCREQWTRDLAQGGTKGSGLDAKPTEVQTGVGVANNTMCRSSDPSSDIEMAVDDIEYVPSRHHSPPEPNIHVHKPNRQARPEEWEGPEDEDFVDTEKRWARRYPGLAGETLGEASTTFERWQADQKKDGSNPWYPFSSPDEWDLAQWLMKSVGQTSIDEYLKLPIVSHQSSRQNESLRPQGKESMWSVISQ